MQPNLMMLRFSPLRYAMPNTSLRFLRVGRPWDTPHWDGHAVVSWCCCCYRLGHTTWGKHGNTFINNVQCRESDCSLSNEGYGILGMLITAGEWVAVQGNGDNYSITLILRDNYEPRSCVLRVCPCIWNEGWLQFWKALSYHAGITVMLLLDHNADIDARQRNQRTALDLAACNGYLEAHVAELLIERCSGWLRLRMPGQRQRELVNVVEGSKHNAETSHAQRPKQ